MSYLLWFACWFGIIVLFGSLVFDFCILFSLLFYVVVWLISCAGGVVIWYVVYLVVVCQVRLVVVVYDLVCLLFVGIGFLLYALIAD